MNRTAARKFETINKADVDEILLYDLIGEFWDEGVSAESLMASLNACEKDTIHLRINSPGGIVFEGRAMAAAIKNCGKRVIAYIDGLCASAATTVAMACEEVHMEDGAQFMIHNAWSVAWGDKNAFLKEAETLEKLDIDIAKDYAAKTGKPMDEIKAMMDEETWFSATEAKEAGFIDVIENERQVNNVFDLSAYRNAPAKKEDPPPVPAVEPAPPAPPAPIDMGRVDSILKIARAKAAISR